MTLAVQSGQASELDRGPAVDQAAQLVIRAPKMGEQARVAHLFRHIVLPASVQILLAVKERPVERLVGGIAGWTERGLGRFRLACLPGVDLEKIAKPLINCAVETARQAGLSQLIYADMLTDMDSQGPVLRANQFEVMRSERFFQVAVSDAVRRVGGLLEKFGGHIPKTWRIESIRHHQPEVVLDLIAPFQLMTPEEVRERWVSGAKGGLDPDFSVILFDGSVPIGTLLTRRKGESLCYDVRVVRHENPRLRSLANLCLFNANVVRHDPANPVRWLEFRGGEHEHRETASLAVRMGGKELPIKHVWARAL